MRIVVVGLGSMGRRRIRLLRQISEEIDIIGVDGKEDRCRQAAEEFSIRTFDDFEAALKNCQPECVVISTSPRSHAKLITKSLLNGCNVFTEINLLSTDYETNIALAKEKGKILFLSSTFLYREEIEYIDRMVNKSGCPVTYVYHVGQYLPDWHPWEEITEYFVGDKETNGCRELFAIELPWICKVFGDIKSYSVLSSRNTSLPIEYNDNYILTVEHTNGNKGLLAVDVLSRKAARNIEIFGEKIYITWDGTPDGLKQYIYEDRVEKQIELYKLVDKQDGYASFIVENAYKNELLCFLDEVKGERVAKYSFEEDLKILGIIDRIEGKN